MTCPWIRSKLTCTLVTLKISGLCTFQLRLFLLHVLEFWLRHCVNAMLMNHVFPKSNTFINRSSCLTFFQNVFLLWNVLRKLHLDKLGWMCLEFLITMMKIFQVSKRSVYPFFWSLISLWTAVSNDYRFLPVFMFITALFWSWSS